MIIDELIRKKREAVDLKQSAHNRMIENVRAFKGHLKTVDDNQKRFAATNPTKARVNTIGARLGMMFKDNEDPFGVEPTPETDGDPEQVRISCEKMTKKIRDCLIESRFSSEARLSIRNHLVALGSMIVKAPVLRSCQKRKYVKIPSPIGESYQVQIEKTIKPLVEFVDPFNWFPESVSKTDDLEYCFEVHLFNKRQMMALKDQPGMNAEAIDEIILLKPEREEVHSMLEDKLAADINKDSCTIDKYAVWEYHGILDPEDYEYACEEYKFPEGSCGIVEAWFCGDKLLKVIAAPFDKEWRVPYFATSYEDEAGTLFGLGVAQLFSESQKAITKAWNAYQHNGFVSAGPQISVDVTMVEPSDGIWAINGPKVWKQVVPGDVGKAFSVFNVPNNSDKHLQLIDMATKMGDDEISYPLMLRGEEGNQNNATAAIISTNANNIITFEKGMKIDAQIINPMIQRLYMYFMDFDDDMEAKGDYAIKAKGADNILIKDLEQQKMMGIVGLAGNPLFAPYLNNFEILKCILNLMDSDTDKLLKPQEEVDQAQQADPRQEMMQAEVQIKQGKLDSQNRALDIQAQNNQDKMKLEVERLQSEKEINRVEAEAKVIAANVNQDTKQMEIAAKVGIEKAKFSEQQLAKTTDARTAAFFQQQELNIKAENVNTKREEMRLKLSPDNKSGTGI